MPEGDFRRPPQLWEQKIANLVAVNAVGSVSGGGTTEVGGDLPPGDGGPPPDPDPIAPTPVAFLPPSTPTVAGTVQGIRVTWDGNNNAAEAYPPDAFVEVHVSTTSGFTPSSSTLRGRLLGSGMFTVFGLVAGTTYFARLVGVDAYGNTTSPSTQASSTTGLTTTGDYGTATIDAGAVSFNARTIGGITTTVGSTTPSSPVTGDIWLDSSGGAIIHKRWNGSAWVTQAWGSDSISAGAVTATQIAAGAITAGAIAAGAITTEKLDALAITADKIAVGAITADKIDANAITGKLIRTAASGQRVEIQVSGANNGQIEFYNAIGNKRGSIYASSGYVTVTAPNGFQVDGDMYGNLNDSIFWNGGARFGTTINSVYGLIVSELDGSVSSRGITDSTTADAANVRIGGAAGGGLLQRSTSSARYKDDIRALTDATLDGVPADKLGADLGDVDLYDVLNVVPAQFRSIAATDDEAEFIGFIAEDVAAKFPFACDYNDAGEPESVKDRPIIAALLAVVRDQQQTITDLTARVTALESA